MTHKRDRHTKKRKGRRIAQIIKYLEEAETIEPSASQCVKEALTTPFENKSNSYNFNKAELETLKDINEIVREDIILVVSQYNSEIKINNSDKGKCSISRTI